MKKQRRRIDRWVNLINTFSRISAYLFNDALDVVISSWILCSIFKRKCYYNGRIYLIRSYFYLALHPSTKLYWEGYQHSLVLEFYYHCIKQRWDALVRLVLRLRDNDWCSSREKSATWPQISRSNIVESSSLPPSPSPLALMCPRARRLDMRLTHTSAWKKREPRLVTSTT